MPRQKPGNLARLFGRRLRARRKASGLTLSQLAARFGSNPGCLSLIETGQRGVSLSMLYSIAFALECSPADLLPPAEDAGEMS